MSVVEDVRQAIQDFIAPELRTLAAKFDLVNGRIEALEQVMNARFESIDVKLVALESTIQARTDQRFDALDGKLQTLINSLDVDRRLAKLEAVAKAPPTTQ